MSKKQIKIQPDDSFSFGPMQFARFGKHIVMKNNMSDKEYEEWQQKIVDHLPNLIQKINDIVSNIVDQIRVLPPDKILHRAWYEMAACHLGMQSESDAGEDEIISLRMVDYLQSVIVSIKPSDDPKEDLSDEDWDKLRLLVKELFRLVNVNYHIGRTAQKRKDNTDFDIDYEEFYFKAQLYWCNVRGDRYLCHEILHLKELLSTHTDVFNDLFGITATQLIESINKIVVSLTRGITKAFQEMRAFQEITMAAVETRLSPLQDTDDVDLPILMEEVLRENGWEQWRNEVFGRVFGLDLFDLEKIANLPRSLLEQLSFGPGDDTEFFSDGEFKGWPLRIWPVFKRPFIKLDHHYYCFDLYTFLDGLYRVVQKMVSRLRSDYKSEWNKKQKEITEQLPFNYLQKILPGAKVYESVYYKWFSSSKTKKEWCEADGIIVYDRYLFVIEVKAGAFTYTSPTDDFPAYIESIKNLVLKPAQQGQRFIEYLKSDTTVKIYNSNHDPIGQLTHPNYGHVINCPISLDSLTEIAGQVQNLKSLKVDVGKLPVWALSINDLRAYADVFDNPLCFLHFCKERLKAFNSGHLQLEDELDHLGMYLQHNHYTQHVEDYYLNTQAKPNFFGYRAKLDRYFYDKFRDPTISSPLWQSIPHRLFELIDVLAKQKEIDKSILANYLLDCDRELQTEIANKIDSTLENQIAKRELIPFSTYGDRKITIVCWQMELLNPKTNAAIEHARAAMLVTGDEERLLIELTCSIAGRIEKVGWNEIQLRDIPEKEIGHLREKSEAIRKRRLKKAGRIGRNDKCPCGSRKKYKKCCLNKERI